LTAAFRLRLIL